MKEDEKIEITVQPIKKIVIFQCMEFSLEEFFKRVELMAISGQPLMLNWSEGIVFLPIPFQSDSDILIEQALKGIMYWSVVIFSSMPKYEPMKKLGGREVPIIDQTSVLYLRQVAQWLKKSSVHV